MEYCLEVKRMRSCFILAHHGMFVIIYGWYSFVMQKKERKKREKMLLIFLNLIKLKHCLK